MKTALVIGGGPAGCAAAHQFALMGGWDVTVVEAGQTLGAGLRTMRHGGHPHTFGPRHFLTKDERVWAYLDAVCPLRSLAGHRFWTYVEGDAAFYDFPIHEDDVERMPERDTIKAELETEPKHFDCVTNFEEYWIRSVGRTLYGKFVDGYSKKMWLVDDNRQLDTFDWSPKGTALKSGPRAAWDEALSGYPLAADGYDDYFAAATADARVLLGTAPRRYDLPRRRVYLEGGWREYDAIVSTVSPDVALDFVHGPLRYVGREFHRLVLPVERAMPEDVFFCYYAGAESFTRVTEFKKMTGYKSDSTLLGIEIPVRVGRHYPMPIKREMNRAALYYEMVPEGVFFMGRHGSYRYGLDFAGCIEQAMALSDMIKYGGRDHPVPIKKWQII